MERRKPVHTVLLLVATIGKRDPETDAGPTGPLRAALELRPRRVLLVALPDVEQQAEATRERIAEALPGTTVTVASLDAADPVDVAELMRAIDRCVLEPLTDVKGGIAVCATSGTPQLSLAATLVMSARAPRAVHYQALDPERAAPPLLRLFDPDALRHLAEVEQAFRAFEACRFPEAELLLARRLNATMPLVSVGQALKLGLKLAQALTAAGELAPGRVANALGGSSSYQGAEQIGKWYRGLAQSRRTNPHWPVEIAALSLRQRKAGLAVPALLTAATAMEVALAVRLRVGHKIDVEKISPEQAGGLPPEIRERLRNIDGSEYRRLEGAENMSALLQEISTGYKVFLLVHERKRVALRDARNSLVHAGKPPGEDTLAQATEFLDELCRAFGWTRPSECPSSPGAIESIAADLRRWAGLGTARMG